MKFIDHTIKTDIFMPSWKLSWPLRSWSFEVSAQLEQDPKKIKKNWATILCHSGRISELGRNIFFFGLSELTRYSKPTRKNVTSQLRIPAWVTHDSCLKKIETSLDLQKIIGTNMVFISEKAEPPGTKKSKKNCCTKK